MADKTKTIKDASDKELDELLIRLRKENEVQNLIGDLKRKSADGSGPYPYDFPSVSTEKPIESLYHIGILGMKWGHKKGPQTTAPSMFNQDSEDHRRASSLKNKPLRELSNSELKDLTNRLNLEKQYKDLTKTEASPGRKIVGEILGNSGKQIATTYTTKYMTKGVEALLKNTAK